MAELDRKWEKGQTTSIVSKKHRQSAAGVAQDTECVRKQLGHSERASTYVPGTQYTLILWERVK